MPNEPRFPGALDQYGTILRSVVEGGTVCPRSLFESADELLCASGANKAPRRRWRGSVQRRRVLYADLALRPSGAHGEAVTLRTLTRRSDAALRRRALVAAAAVVALSAACDGCVCTDEVVAEAVSPSGRRVVAMSRGCMATDGPLTLIRFDGLFGFTEVAMLFGDVTPDLIWKDARRLTVILPATMNRERAHALNPSVAGVSVEYLWR